MNQVAQRMEELRELVAEALELEPEELTDTADFVEDHDADSLRAIEILSRLEHHYGLEIPQAEMDGARSLKTVYDMVARYAGW
ncbi:MAG: acyl carrier protein [Micromonosporaceae bacterium]